MAVFAISFIHPLKAICQSDVIPSAASANRAYAAVFAHSSKPCPADSTFAYIECMDKELTFVEQHLDAFIDGLRQIVSSSEELAGLNQADTTWRAYRESMCALPYKRFPDGTIKGPMIGQCRLNLDRDYMKQLNSIYVLSQFPK